MTSAADSSRRQVPQKTNKTKRSTVFFFCGTLTGSWVAGLTTYGIDRDTAGPWFFLLCATAVFYGLGLAEADFERLQHDKCC